MSRTEKNEKMQFRLLDPDGKDEYEFNSKGKIRRVKRTCTDSFHKVDDKGKRIDGVSLSFDKKIVVRQFNLGTEKSEIEVNFLKIKGDDESRKVFEFFSNNSTENKAEYVNVAIGKRTGASGLNLLGANVNHIESSSHGITAVYDNYYTLRRADHNHPSGSNGVSEADVNTAKMVQSKFPKATLFNFTVTSRYTPFDKNTTPVDSYINLPEFEIIGTK